MLRYRQWMEHWTVKRNHSLMIDRYTAVCTSTAWPSGVERQLPEILGDTRMRHQVGIP